MPTHTPTHAPGPAHTHAPRSIVAGLVLALVGAGTVLVAAALDLEIESVALVGTALGAVVALVPDRAPTARALGFAAGFLAAWVGYVVRAAVLPDSASGRAVAVVVVVLLCVGVTALTWGRLPLWATLLGVVPLAGSYEAAFAAAPPEVVSTSLSAATALLLALAIGFLAAALVAPLPDAAGRRSARRTSEDPAAPDGAARPAHTDQDIPSTPLASMMENDR